MLFKALLLVCTASLCVANKVKPCALNDYNCIRNNLRANSQCNPNVWSMIPNQYTIDSAPFETPYFNASYIHQNLVVTNHNKCFISEFFFNTDTKVVVIGLDCPNIILQSDLVRLQHYSLNEDVITKAQFKVTYPLIRFTMNVPYSYGLNICPAFTFADFVILPPNSNLIFEREKWSGNAANFFMRYFINSILCNFGCNF